MATRKKGRRKSARRRTSSYRKKASSCACTPKRCAAYEKRSYLKRNKNKQRGPTRKHFAAHLASPAHQFAVSGDASKKRKKGRRKKRKFNFVAAGSGFMRDKRRGRKKHYGSRDFGARDFMHRDWPGNHAGHHRAAKKAWRKKTSHKRGLAWHRAPGYRGKPYGRDASHRDWPDHPRLHRRAAKKAWRRKTAHTRYRAWRS